MAHRIELSSACAVAFALLVCCPPCSSAESKPRGIEGKWLVVSVELAGQKIDNLQGAELTLAGGKKTFKLPSDTVEKGTYTLDETKNPKQIDATTEGKDGTEKGIYALEGDTLKLCLATQGGPRPGEFATKKGTDLILIVLRRAAANQPDDTARRKGQARAFRMGFTGFVHDITPEAVAASRKFVRENGDILAHHIEGVPWAEALSGKPFPKAVARRMGGQEVGDAAEGEGLPGHLARPRRPQGGGQGRAAARRS